LDQDEEQEFFRQGFTDVTVLPDGRKMYSNPETWRWVMSRDPNLPPGWPATIPADWVCDETGYYPPLPPEDPEVEERLRRQQEEFQEYLAELRRNPPKKEIIKVDWSSGKSPQQKALSRTPPRRKTDAQLSLFGEDEADRATDDTDESA
jgi:hypothetical protein